MEAEIESTDTLQPLPNELFGEQLLVAKFRLTDTLEKSTVRSSGSVEREEMATPPGTVPRSQQNRRLSLVAAPPRISAKTKPPVAATVVTMVSDTSRPDSVSSQQTFILENSRRRPLVARDPFKIGFSFFLCKNRVTDQLCAVIRSSCCSPQPWNRSK